MKQVSRVSKAPFRLIKGIEISYMRSLYKATITDVGDLNILFGRNDSGKSNFLRALNLFFNQETDPGTNLDFSLDLSDSRKKVASDAKKRKFLSIKIEFNVPPTFKSLGETVFVKRQWNSDGDMSETFPKSVASGNGGRGQAAFKSSVTKFMKLIDYTYVPAIKGREVFGALIERMYNAVAENSKLKSAVDGFIESVRGETTALAGQIEKSIGKNAKLSAPTKMSQLFRDMDFTIGDESHSLLFQKGDGVKAKHIPAILKYINENESAKRYYIWGFEEPENSLDLQSAEAEAKAFVDMAEGSKAQIFITSHSPVFYLAEAQGRRNIKIGRFFVSKQEEHESDGKSNISPRDAIERIDELEAAEKAMGAAGLTQLPFLVRVLGEERERQEELENRVKDLNKANLLARPALFVEGESDKLIYERALKVFFNISAEKLSVICNPKGGGDNYVKQSLEAWRIWCRQGHGEPRAAGVVDLPRESRPSNDLNTFNNGKSEHAKLFEVTKSSDVIGYLKKGVKLPVDLESQYGLEIINYAKERGYLVDASLKDRLPDKVQEDLLNGKEESDEVKAWKADPRVALKVDALKKVKLAEDIYKKDDDYFRTHLAQVEVTLRPIVDYLLQDQSVKMDSTG